MRILIFLISFLSPIICFAQLINGSMVHDGLTRTYILYLPPNIQANAPLVFNLHGHTSNATERMNVSQMNAVADNFGFAVCYPQGSLSFAGNPFWDADLDIGDADDLGFLTNLASNLQTTYALNPNETFSCGFSNGAYMSYYLACNASTIFRAIAPVGGLMHDMTYNNCSPSNPVPVLHIHGEKDAIVPIAGYPDYNDGWGGAESAISSVQYWSNINMCNTTSIKDTSVIEGTTIYAQKFDGCANEVSYYLIKGEGHTWPGSTNSNVDYFTSEVIWCFFNQYTNSIQINTDFEGGNGKLKALGPNNHVRLASEFKDRDTENITFYCELSDLDPTMPLLLETESSYAGDYCFYSYDQISWSRSNMKSGGIINIPLISNKVYVAHFPPYLYSRITSILDSLKNVADNHYQVIELTKSEDGHPVEMVKITDPCYDNGDKKLVWVLGRQHAFEHPANYVTEGMLQFFVSNDPLAQRIRKEAIIYIVPMMDVDSAIDGASGKDQDPVDFNRDWISPSHTSHWNAVKAAKTWIANTTSQNELSLFIDSHSISPTGSDNFHVYQNITQQEILMENFDNRSDVHNSFTYGTVPFNNLNTATSQDFVLQYYNTPSLLSITPETNFHFADPTSFWTVNKLIDQGKIFGHVCSDFINGTDFQNQTVVDNINTSSISTTGSWIPTTFEDGYYGADYLYVTENSDATITYNISNIPESLYEVSVFYNSYFDQATNLKANLDYSGGTRNYTLDQTVLGGQWQIVDTLTIPDLTNIDFTIDANGSNGFVVADGFRIRSVNLSCPTARTYTYAINDFVNYENIHDKAQIQINASNVIGNNAQVIYDAGDFVELNANFEVQLGALFDIKVDGCP